MHRDATAPVLPNDGNGIQRLQEQGIHLERLIYLTKEEFLFFKKLRGDFLRKAARFFKKPLGSKKERSQKPLKQRSYKQEGNDHGFRYRNSGTWLGRETLRWQWIRAYEYDKEIRSEQRYERQGKLADRIMKDAAYNKMINY